MRKERIQAKVADLVLNKGQLEWLPKNPRQWTQTDIDLTKQSLERDPDFQEDNPLKVVELPDGKLLVFAGNLRTTSAKALKWKTFEAIKYYPETDEDRATVKRRALLDNGSFGAWDFDALANEWDDLPLADFGVPSWEPEEKDGGPTVTEDDFNPDDATIQERCKAGDIWLLGDHRLMCGDSTDAEVVKRLMNGDLADMVFTDPPYGVSYTDKNEFLNRIGKPMAFANPIENDSQSPTEMADFWETAFNVLAECTKDKMVYYITAPQGGDLLLLLQSIFNTPFALKHMLIWNKNNHVLGRCDYNYKHEPIVYGWKKKGTHNFYGGGKFKTTVWDIDKPLKNDLHPTMKPVELVANCILDGSKAGDIVLDTFGGSGTTLIAAEQTGRKCYMMELDPHYCDVILSRWETLTGQTAQLSTDTAKVS